MALALSKTPSQPRSAPATYKLVVRSADEAVKAIRDQLGAQARVLSVRQLPGQGLSGLFGRPRLEVIAQIAPPETPAAFHAVLGDPAPAERAPTSADSVAFDRAALVARDRPSGLPDLLKRSGFSPSLIARLESAPQLAEHARKPLHRVLVDVGGVLGSAAQRRPVRPLPASAAFLGSPGSGRTTALCKWLARDVFTNGRQGRVFKAEFERPNPTEGLGVFCEALGLFLEHADTGAALGPVASGQFAYVDTPALSVRRPQENRALQRFLDDARIEGRVLVLNALYDLSVLRETYAVGRDLGATHLVFTHLDELEHWGRLWDFLIEGELSPLFLSTGAGLTGDLVTDLVGAVLRRTLPGAPVPHLS